MKIIALDVGEKRIGVARADSSTRIAIPIGCVTVDGSEWQEIAKIARLNNANLFVLGLPRSNEGSETAQSAYVRRFAKMMVEKIPDARVRFQDESLTSVLAEERLKSRKKRYEKGDIDAEAAAIILQDFIENFEVNQITNKEVKAKSIEMDPDNASLAIGVKNIATEVHDGVVNINKKEVDKIKLNTKKAKHKMKKTTKWITWIIVLTILALGTTGVGVFLKKQYDRAEYAKWVAEQEAKPAEVFSFRIDPGETIFDVKKSLMGVGYSETEVDEALNATYDYSFLASRPAGATLEGYLYGETHEFYKDAPAKAVINTFLEGMGKVIRENSLEARYAAQGLSLYEGITLASIVQREAPAPDMSTVAQVFLTRLNYGILLGSDVTVSYALDTIDPNRQTYTDNHAALSVDSCYNTRLYAGLPCGPISNPGLSALIAVAEPADTSYLYFLTGDDGMMYYSNTEDEHIQNIYEHCQTLCDISL